MTVQPGIYPARATGAELGYTNSNSEQIGVAFALLGPDGQPTNQVITWYGYFTDKTTQRTIESLRHCGWQGDDLSDLSTVGTKDVEIVVEDEQDEKGQTRTRVRWVNAIGASGPAIKNKMDDHARKAFAAKMRGTVIAANGNKASPKPAAPQRSAPARPPNTRDESAQYAPTSDDIPF